MNRKSMLILTGLLLLALASFGVRGSYSEGGDSSGAPARIERVLPNGWRVSPAGRQISLSGDLVLKMLVTPDGKYLLVNTGGYHDHAVSAIGLETETVHSSVNVLKDWAGLALDPSTGAVFVSGGGLLQPHFYLDPQNRNAPQLAVTEAQHPV